MILNNKSLRMFLFEKEVIGLMLKFFNKRSSGDIIGIGVKVMLGWFQKVELKLEEAYVFSLPKGELF